MRLDIRYRTTFTYEDLVRESQNELRACPVSDEHQQLIAYRVVTLAGGQGALLHRLLGHPGRQLRPAPAPRGPRGRGRGLGRDLSATAAHRGPAPGPAQPGATSSTATTSTSAVAARRVGPGRGGTRPSRQRDFVGDDLVSLVLALHRVTGARAHLRPGATDIGIEVEEVLAQGKGVCQDYAHLAVALCRSQGIPARYVSGYLFTRDDSTGADVEGGDVVNVQTHAWFEAAHPRLRLAGARPDQPAGGRRPPREDRPRPRLRRRAAPPRRVLRHGHPRGRPARRDPSCPHRVEPHLGTFDARPEPAEPAAREQKAREAEARELQQQQQQ